MLIAFCLLLMLRVGRGTDNQKFVTKLVGVGEDVTLTCTYSITNIETYFWIKLCGDLPEILGRAYSFGYVDKTVISPTISRLTTKQVHGTFFLDITKTKPSDTGFYYCLKSHRYNITFLKGIFLRVKDPGPSITGIIQDLPPDPVHPGDSVTLRCSVLFESGQKTCVEDRSVFWFRVGVDESKANLIYALGNSSDHCEKGPDARSPQKCVHSFSKNITSSDAGTYYCAVATCGEILFGNGTKLDVEVVSMYDSQRNNTVLFLLCVAFAASLIVTAFLACAAVKTHCDCCVGATNVNQESHQRNEDTLVYSTVSTFIRTKGRRKTAAQEETIYTGVRASSND